MNAEHQDALIGYAVFLGVIISLLKLTIFAGIFFLLFGWMFR